MQKAPVMKSSGLVPVEDSKHNEEVHVFGKNLEERVVAESDEQPPSTSFGSIIDEHKQIEDDIETIRNRKFDAVTGEEDEETVFQGEFKLFAWDLATSNWIEKGRGQLKLNDSIDQDEKKSRLIMRLSGTLRIILNVAIKNSFFRVIACSKTNIRFTNSQTVWAASGANTNQLANLIDERLKISATQDKIEATKRARSDDGEDEVEEVALSKKAKPESSTKNSKTNGENSEQDESGSHERSLAEKDENNVEKSDTGDEEGFDENDKSQKEGTESSQGGQSSESEVRDIPEEHPIDEQETDGHKTSQDTISQDIEEKNDQISSYEGEDKDESVDKVEIKVTDSDEKSKEEGLR